MNIKTLRKNRGFTLLEMIMVVIISSIIVVMSTKYLMQGLTSYTSSQQINFPDWQGNIALDRMTREIRSIENSVNITTATSTIFSFIDATSTPISYQITSGNLDENANTLVAGVSTLNFTYYDRNGAVTSTSNLIHFVQVSLTIVSNGYTYVYSTTIYLPNIP